LIGVEPNEVMVQPCELVVVNEIESLFEEQRKQIIEEARMEIEQIRKEIIEFTQEKAKNYSALRRDLHNNNQKDLAISLKNSHTSDCMKMYNLVRLPDIYFPMNDDAKEKLKELEDSLENTHKPKAKSKPKPQPQPKSV